MSDTGADTAKAVLESARQAGIFPPQAELAHSGAILPEHRGKIVRVLELTGPPVRALVRLEDSSDETITVPPEHLYFLKVETEQGKPPPSPPWERGLHRSAIGVAEVLWKTGDVIEAVGYAIERGGRAVNDAGHFVLDRAIKLTNKIRGWDD